MITTSASAFSPGSLSCIFTIEEHEDPRWMGSKGLGFTIDKGVTVTVAESKKSRILLNGKEINLPQVQYILNTLDLDHVIGDIITDLPLGYGCGVSGASALATAYALNSLFDLRKTKRELAIIAHKADVVSRTGLGDVGNMYVGGMNAKFVPSSRFRTVKLPITNTPVYVRFYGKLLTSSIVGDRHAKERINTAGNNALAKVQKLLDDNTVSFAKAIALSKVFAIESGLLRDKTVIAAIDAIEKEGGHASMVMLGNAVYSDIPFAGSTTFVITETPAHVL